MTPDPLTPLRAALTAAQCSNGPCCEKCDSDPMTYIPIFEVWNIFDAFAAQHTLIDLSVCGPECPGYTTIGAKQTPFCLVLYAAAVGTLGTYSAAHAPTNQPCPVLAERGKP